MQTVEDFKDRELIKTFNSERYGDHTQWKDMLTMSYVDKYEVVEGRNRDRFIKRYIENTMWQWEDNILNSLDMITKLNNTLIDADNYIDTEKAIKEWLNIKDNLKQLEELLKRF